MIRLGFSQIPTVFRLSDAVPSRQARRALASSLRRRMRSASDPLPPCCLGHSRRFELGRWDSRPAVKALVSPPT